jgi:hypothetical protein
MAIDYDTDILPFYATNVVTDPEYSAIPAALRNDDAEQRILTTIEIVKAHLETLTSRTESNMLLYSLSRLAARTGSGGFVYDDLGIRAEANVSNPILVATDDIRFVEPDGTQIAIVAAGGVTVAALVTAINGTAALGAEGITAAVENGRLVIFQAAPAAGFGITIGVGAANDQATVKTGIHARQYVNKVVETAHLGRDQALSNFVNTFRDADL